MREGEQVSNGPFRIGCVFAFALVFVPGVLASALLDLPGREWPMALIHGVLLATPFAYLALEGAKAWLPWGVATALSACFWGAYISSFTVSDGSGSDFGVGFLMMLVSPFVITTGAWAAVQFTKCTEK